MPVLAIGSRSGGKPVVFNCGSAGSIELLNGFFISGNSPSREVQDLFDIKATEIGVANPFDQAADVIDRITEQLETVPLYGDLFPEIINPFKVPLTQGIPQTISSILPQSVTGFIGQNNINTNQVQGLTPQEIKLRAQGKEVFNKPGEIIF